MTGVILQLPIIFHKFDKQLLTQQLRTTLAGMGFDNAESLSSANPVTEVPTFQER
jgi:hypothetical protein